MAKTETSTINPFSSAFTSLVRSVCKPACDEYEWDTGSTYCVPAPKVAARLIKDHKKELPVPLRNQQVLYTVVSAAVAAGLVPGFGIRRGRNGGIYPLTAEKAEEVAA
jgi:hypothetical protein